MLEISDILEVRKHIEGLKAVIFDLDDTLYSEKEYVRSGYGKIAKVIPQVEDAAEKLWTLFEEKKPAIDELLKKEKIDSEEVKQACLHAYRYQIPDIHLYEGVAKMLKEFRSDALRIHFAFPLSTVELN